MALLYRDDSTAPITESYRVFRTTAHASLLEPSSPEWEHANAIAWGPTPWRTHFRALSAEGGLAVRFDCADDAPWHTLTARDASLWEEEVVEIFLDPTRTGRDYAELEISPANVVCDLRINRTAPHLQNDLAFDIDGLQTRVHPWRDQRAGAAGWTATALLPWASVLRVTYANPDPGRPDPGATWHFNVFRIKRPGGPGNPERGAIYAAWSVPQGSTFHAPEAFQPMVFA